MPYYGYKKRRAGYRRKRPIKKRATRARPVRSVRAIARQVVHQMSENKHMVPLVGLDLRVNHDLADTSTQIINLSPRLNQGAEQGERVGNSVRHMSSKLLLQLSATQTTASINPGPNYFDIYIYKYKPSHEPLDVNLNQFLQFGSTAIPYQGGLAPYSGMLNINKDLFTKKFHKRVKLWNPSPTSGTDSYPEYAGSSVGMAPLGTTCVVDTTKFINKVLKYNDNTSLPTNDNLFLSIVYTSVDGRDNGTTGAGKFTFVHQMTYEDN